MNIMIIQGFSLMLRCAPTLHTTSRAADFEPPDQTPEKRANEFLRLERWYCMVFNAGP